MNAAVTPAPSPRYHGFDSLRAVMMLLVIVVHSGASYSPVLPDGAYWPFQDTQTSAAIGWLLGFMHIFMMPAFFLTAGFFGALLLEGRGVRRFARNRLARIGVPLICAWPIFYVVLVYGINPFALQFNVGEVPPLESPGVHLLHLWFLWHLLILYAVAVPVVAAARRLPAAWREHGMRIYERLAGRWLGVLALAAAITPLLMQMETWHFDSQGRLLPKPHVLAADGLFVLFGWLLYHGRNLLERFTKRAWAFLLTGFLAQFGFFFVRYLGCPDSNSCGSSALPAGSVYGHLREAGLSEAALLDGTHLAAMGLFSLSVWLLVYGLLGLFLRYAASGSPVWRYVSDASYWMYLVHLPLVIPMVLAVRNVPAPVGLKYGLALAGVTAACVISYHYLVRATFIGRMLNGRRYPRVWPLVQRRASSRSE